MKNNLTLAMTLLLTLGVTACSGGSKTGEIPKTVQPGTVVVEKESSEELEKLKAELAQAEQEASDAKAKLAQAEKEAQNAKEALEQQQVKQESENSQPSSDTNETPAENSSDTSTLSPKTNDYLIGETAVAIDELKKAIENGTELQKQAATDGKNINSLIGANAKLPAGTILTTTANTYGGYAVIRETYSETIGGGNTPFNSYVAVANTATTDKNAVVDATYKGSAAYSTGNMITLMEKANTGEAQFEFTLNVKDNAVSGGIANTNANIQAKRAELGQAEDMISFKHAEVSVIDDVVGFKGDAQFNYGWGFLPNATGDGKGQYQGVFTGKNAEGVVGTFSTTDTQKENSVQGAFVGSR